MNEPKKVLSIDGGGIRGIIPAMVLKYIEQQTGKPISQLFDLIAGTSTGGILALGLVTPSEDGNPKYTAEDLLNLYRKEGSNIFSQPDWYRILSGWSWIDAKYPTDGIEEVLDDYFGSARLKQALTEVIVTGYEIERNKPWFFRSRRARNPELTTEYDFPMKVVARATSAAPTYFDPKRIDNSDEDNYYALVDGGVYANNPAMCAYVEAKTTFPGDDILLLSLGTGELNKRILFDEAKDWGRAQWVKPILDVVFDGVADTISYQLKQLLPENRYFRFQVRLREDMDLDDVSEPNLRELNLLAENLINNEKRQLDKLINALE